MTLRWRTAFDINGNPERSFYALAPTGDVYTLFRADRSNIDRQGTLEESIALAEELIAQSEYPERYQIIVHE